MNEMKNFDWIDRDSKRSRTIQQPKGTVSYTVRKYSL